MSSPAQVTQAVANPHFYVQQKAFWQMLVYLLSKYQERPVHTYLPPETFRKICVQLNALIELSEDYAVLTSNRDLLYHTYFMLLGYIRGQKTITRMTCDETQEVLHALHQIYKRLRELKFSMPLFAHPVTVDT